MAEIKLFFADCAGVPSNCSYPHEAVITDEALLRRPSAMIMCALPTGMAIVPIPTS